MIQLDILPGDSDGGLLFSMIFFGVLAIFFIILIFNTLKEIAVRKEQRLNNIGYLAGYLFTGFCLGYGFLINYHLLYHPIYAEGTIIGKCPKAKIEFEYYMDGVRYTNCSSYKSKHKIKIPGGKFIVRVSSFDLSGGRIDFEQPITADSK
ncbi:MAG: hypothetical protein ACK5RG_21330 [Cyclobacteriaceae bacterium]|jgi:hypothetical protein